MPNILDKTERRKNMGNGDIALKALSLIRESISAHGEFKDLSDATDLINYIAGITDFAAEMMWKTEVQL